MNFDATFVSPVSIGADSQNNNNRTLQGVIGHLFHYVGKGDKRKLVLNSDTKGLLANYAKNGFNQNKEAIIVGRLNNWKKGLPSSLLKMFRADLALREEDWRELEDWQETLSFDDNLDKITLSGKLALEHFRARHYGENGKLIDPSEASVDGIRRVTCIPLFSLIDAALDRPFAHEWRVTRKVFENELEWVEESVEANNGKADGNMKPSAFDNLHSWLKILKLNPHYTQAAGARRFRLNAGAKQRMAAVARLMRNYPEIESLQNITADTYRSLDKERARVLAVPPIRKETWEKDHPSLLAANGLKVSSKGQGGGAYTKREHAALVSGLETEVLAFVTDPGSIDKPTPIKARVESLTGHPCDAIAELATALLITEDDKRKAEIADMSNNSDERNAYRAMAKKGTALYPAIFMTDPETGETTRVTQKIFDSLFSPVSN